MQVRRTVIAEQCLLYLRACLMDGTDYCILCMLVCAELRYHIWLGDVCMYGSIVNACIIPPVCYSTYDNNGVERAQITNKSHLTTRTLAKFVSEKDCLICCIAELAQSCNA
jgi:hypothetical protein